MVCFLCSLRTLSTDLILFNWSSVRLPARTAPSQGICACQHLLSTLLSGRSTGLALMFVCIELRTVGGARAMSLGIRPWACRVLRSFQMSCKCIEQALELSRTMMLSSTVEECTKEAACLSSCSLHASLTSTTESRDRPKLCGPLSPALEQPCNADASNTSHED